MISEQLRTLNKYSASVYNIFELIRKNYISSDETIKEQYKMTFHKCFSEFLNGNGPPDYKLAVRHYVSSTRNNSPCYIKTQDNLMDTRILDPEYLNALSEIYLTKIEGREIPQEFVSIAKRKLIHFKFPLTLITTKLAKD